jgi:hypothetical protein
MHGEFMDPVDSYKNRSILPAHGAYHVQWRGVEPNAQKELEAEDGWQDPKKLISPYSVISKKNLAPSHQWQVRVRARLGQCRCGKGASPGKPYEYLECAGEFGVEKGCAWTPWSEPSALATPSVTVSEKAAPIEEDAPDAAMQQGP